jgi:hypothetical protein
MCDDGVVVTVRSRELVDERKQVRRPIKLLAAAAVTLSSLALTPGMAQAHFTDDTAILLCEYFKPHTGDTLAHAHTFPVTDYDYEAFNCRVTHPGGISHYYFVTRWGNGELSWTPGYWYCEDVWGDPYFC